MKAHPVTGLDQAARLNVCNRARLTNAIISTKAAAAV
jgi:hypothetical protein